MDKINVLYYGCPYDLSGYATVARNHLREMGKIPQLNIRMRPKKFWGGVAPDLGEFKKTLIDMESVSLPANDFIFIEHLTPENFFIDQRAKYHIAYTPFETDGAPGPWLLPLRGMDEIWVPSSYNRQAYIHAGLDANKIKVIVHGVNPDIYHPEVKPLKYNRGKFNFGSIFDWTERKNPTALIRAYFNAFTDREDVTMTIRTFWRFQMDKTHEYIKREIDSIKSQFNGRSDFPKLLLWFDTMDESMMAHFYRSFDCFVLPSRGEGFGLPYIESMACGVPTVAPDIGGQTEFMHRDNSFLIKSAMTPINHAMYLRLQPQYANQNWIEIDEGELSKKMRWIYEHQKEAQEIALHGSNEVRTHWTWVHTAQKIYNRLKEVNVSANQRGMIKNSSAYMEVR